MSLFKHQDCEGCKWLKELDLTDEQIDSAHEARARRTKMAIQAPSCPRGYTQQDLEKIFGDELRQFADWMVGQTAGICDGRIWNYEKHRHEPTECAGNPHGLVTYRYDVERYIDHRDNGTPLIWD